MNWLKRHKARTMQIVLLVVAAYLYFGRHVNSVSVYLGLLAAFVLITGVSMFVASRNEPVNTLRL